ncbi:MAG: DUF192 domain-containing protein [Chthoniobacterales bacterium]|nr:DUF192 domain-containing protein [Chthoniobacterales bacterium]
MLFFFLFFEFTAFSYLSLAAAPSASSFALSHQAGPTCTTLTIGKNRLDVRLATDPTSRETGLMKESSLGPNEGMLFVFPFPQRVSFWMKDTPLPLSIAYLSQQGHILEIHDLEPFNQHSILSNSTAILYTIEMPRGWFEEHEVLPGDVVTGLPPATIAH